MVDTCIAEEVPELVTSILAAIISLEAFDGLSSLVFHHCFVVSKVTKDLILASHQVNSSEPGVVVDEGDCILVPFCHYIGHLANDITVNKL